MKRIKKIFKDLRVIILLAVLLLSAVAIYPNFWNEGATIRAVGKNSSAELAGIANPSPTSTPMAKERVLALNNLPVEDAKDFYDIQRGLEWNTTITLKTNKQVYRLELDVPYNLIILDENETVETVEQVSDNETNETFNVTTYIQVPKTEKEYLWDKEVDLGLSVYDAPKTNLRKGLDLQGGTRVLLEPEQEVDDETFSVVVDNMKERLNVFGLTDIIVKPVYNPFSGAKYILVEIAGANEEEVQELIAKQGKFEARIGNETVFFGGDDISYVCRSAQCAFAIDPQRGCGQSSDGRYYCQFTFSISLSPEAAQRQADITSGLDVVLSENGEEYLSQKLDLYLDDVLVDQLNIAADLKGRAITDIAISGSGTGVMYEEAVQDSAKNMKRLQTILITGSLPVKLHIIKSDSISPVLGEEFTKSALLIGLVSILAVALVIYIRYRVWQIIVPVVVTMVSEVIVLLGFAALIGWNLDIAAIAGIIVAVGTGVDDQIVITDETLADRKKNEEILDWRQRIKKAFFIIIVAYTTTVVAMLPLWFAGAGLVKGLALTTIVGVTIGVLITRPAFARIIEIILKA
ncbi:hypothetical protein JW968_02815 [Candidatus Woesearchaeota archaeon]|nr:hypothetical protein [Candidatus Woesearchaeota archaeon]